MEKLNLESKNLTASNIEKIAQLFPGCITESADKDGNLQKSVDFETLRAELGDDVAAGNESYEFNWVGKAAAKAEANTPSNKTLRPVKEDSVNWDNTENLYIEGDNLEVLKLLQESYLGKVKMIYIDPPYNTGKDELPYDDNASLSKKDYNKEAGELLDDGTRMVANLPSNPRFHSRWCSDLYKRLSLARNLLTPDGVIFISIDDNEFDNLKKICDELLGAENYLETFHIQVRYANKSLNEKDDFQKLIEYCLVYARNRELFTPRKEMVDYDLTKFNLNIQELNKPDKKIEINNRKVDIFLPESYRINAVDDEDCKSLNYFKETWVTGSIYSGTGHGLVYKQVVEPRRKDDGDGVLYKIYGLGNDGLGYRYMTGPKQVSAKFGKMYNKIPLDKIKGIKEGTYKKSKPIINYFDYSPDFGNISHEGGMSFNGGKKPVKFLTKLLDVANLNDGDIVLDFYSGSASTAHAVMDYGIKSLTKIKYLMVQIPAKTKENSRGYKDGFENICEIGKERIRRAAKKIHEDNPDAKFDDGFRVLRLDSSNYEDVSEYVGETSQETVLDNINNIKDDRSAEDLLFNCLISWGVTLDRPYEELTIGDNKILDYDNGSLVACFDEDISEGTVAQIAKMKPMRVVFRDSSFADCADRINVENIFKELSPNTKVKVI